MGIEEEMSTWVLTPVPLSTTRGGSGSMLDCGLVNVIVVQRWFCHSSTDRLANGMFMLLCSGIPNLLHKFLRDPSVYKLRDTKQCSYVTNQLNDYPVPPSNSNARCCSVVCGSDK